MVEQQRANFEVGVELTKHIRELEPEGITVSVGGEIGEVGKENSTESELRAYLDNFNELLDKELKGATSISKISIQTGTSHGGVPGPDGKVVDVNLDFECLDCIWHLLHQSTNNEDRTFPNRQSCVLAFSFYTYPYLPVDSI